MKTIKGLIITIVLSIFLIVSTNAGTTKYDNYAELLSQMKVFVGTGNGFDLDREPTRLEGLVMLIRLLGVEDEAKAMAGDETHFTDVPSWGLGYVNYAYTNGLTNGISETEFGSTKLMQAKSYMTFLLRALGYDDSSGDFTWSEAVEYAMNVGILSENEYFELSSNTFLRDHVAKVSYQTLMVNMKDDSTTLISHLINQGAIDAEIAAEIIDGEVDVVVDIPDEGSLDLAELAKSCVYIEVESVSGEGSTGSGFYISADGRIVTNYHVIENAASIKVYDDDGTLYASDVIVLGYDIDRDIAVIDINVTGKVPLVLGDSNSIKLADKIYAIGSPIGLQNTVSEGIVSAIRINDIQISAPISPGSSGGALFNDSGEVIGITYAGIIEGENLGFAIPINALSSVDLTAPKTLAQLFGSPVTIAPLTLSVWNDNGITHFQWNDVSGSNYYLWYKYNGSDWNQITNTNGTDFFTFVEGYSSLTMNDLYSDTLYEFAITTYIGDTFVESNAISTYGTKKSTYTLDEVVAHLNANRQFVTAGGRVFMVKDYDYNTVGGTINIFAHIDSNSAVEVFTTMQDSDFHIINSIATLALEAESLLGLPVNFTLIYSDFFLDYPSAFTINHIYSDTITWDNEFSQWWLYYPIVAIETTGYGTYYYITDDGYNNY